jgi:hypothetical protein
MEACEWYISHALTECLASAPELRAIGKGKKGTHSAPVLWAGTDVHPLNAQRCNQLAYNQEIKSL